MDVCPATPLPFDPTKGISTTSFTPDSSTGRVPASTIASYIASLRSQGLLPTAATYTNPPGDLATQINTDVDTYKKLQAEYCYYEPKYKTALSEYLTAATSADTSQNVEAKNKIQLVTQLNLRLNSLLEIMNALSQDRASNVQSNKDSINQWNKQISTKLSGLQAQYNRIKGNKETVLRQNKMIEYTTEKNQSVSNQIGLYIALNIAAIGLIFFVSRSL